MLSDNNSNLTKYSLYVSLQPPPDSMALPSLISFLPQSSTTYQELLEVKNRMQDNLWRSLSLVGSLEYMPSISTHSQQCRPVCLYSDDQCEFPPLSLFA